MFKNAKKGNIMLTYLSVNYIIYNIYVYAHGCKIQGLYIFFE